MNFKCPNCGLTAKITSGHQIEFCPSCGKNKQGKKKEGFMEKVMKFGNWLSEPVTVYSNISTENPEALNAYANLIRARAEEVRARKSIPEQSNIIHQHVHVIPEQSAKAKKNKLEITQEDDEDEVE